MNKKLFPLVIGLLVLQASVVTSAFQPKETAKYFNGPTVTSVGDTSAQVSLSQAVLHDFTPEEKVGVYFQYYETRQVCIMIYPTPEHCLPKKTSEGKTEVTLSDLKPDTSYTVLYKRDNTIRCITAPCPGNEFESLSVEFITRKAGYTNAGGKVDGKKEFKKNLRLGHRGDDVRLLQELLIQNGHMSGVATSYFGPLTFKAVKKYQKENKLPETGLVGVMTREILSKYKENVAVTPTAISTTATTTSETFEGIVTAFSTGCYADGECSVSVDGKKVITTIGWSQETVGKLLGVPDLGAVEKNIGSRAKVYAKKVEGGHSLYGSADYYVEIFAPVTSLSKASQTMSFFISSKNKGNGADLGGLEGADAYCATLAKEAGVGDKTWKAYLSTASYNGTLGINARDRIGNGPWYNYNGELIASDLNQLHTGNALTKQTALTEKGGIVFGRGDSVNIHDILTGSNEYGMTVATSTDTTCNNWTSSEKGSAYVGHHDRIGINDSAPMKSWNSSHLSRGCSLPALRASGGGGLIYCFAK